MPPAILLISVLGAAGPSGPADADGTEEVEVDFLGDEEVAAGTVVEEVSRESLGARRPLPEYDHRGWLWLLAALCVALCAWNVDWRPERRTRWRRAGRLRVMNRPPPTHRGPVALALLSAAAALTVAPRPAEAVKYMSLGEAVKRFIPADSKIFKVTKPLDAAARKRLETDYGWTADKDRYVFYVGKRDGQATAYVFVVPEAFNTCFHKYAVGLTPAGAVIETVIVELSCPRAFPVNRRAFLAQLDDKTHQHALTTRKDVDAVTGATLSSEATATAARKAVSLHNLFFGGAQPVTVADDVRAARVKAAGMILKAIETGETLDKEGKGGAAQLPADYAPE